MKLGQIAEWGKSGHAANKEAKGSDTKRCLTLLIEGAALRMPEVDTPSYKEFREHVDRLALKMPDRLPEDDKLELIQEALGAFERYHTCAEIALRERLSAWRALTSKLLAELLNRLGIDSSAAAAAQMTRRVASLLTGEEIHAFLVLLADFLRVSKSDGQAVRASPLKVADRTLANDNASGLRGGGAAVEHVRKIMDQGGRGFVVLFQLGLLDVIGDRFGVEVIQDSLMAVSAYLTASLRNDDAVYHWSDSSLLAVLQTPSSEQILTAAMRRIVDNNRDITIHIGGRSVMLRIPLEFEMIPIGMLNSAEDLYKLSPVRAARK
ncbi:MAG: diguanylate cyclase [Terracidiphilus sp.]|jgi:GGDEF domain-containing protein